MAKNDVLPSGDPKYNTSVNILIAQVILQATAWAIPTTVITAVTKLLATWNSMWAIASNRKNRTTVDVENKKAARKALTAYLRPFIKTYIYDNSLLTSADIISCGLNPHSTTKTPSGIPGTIPEMQYKPDSDHTVKSFYKQEAAADGTTGRGKPDGVGYIEIASFVGATPPASPNDYTKMTIGTRSPVAVQFNASQAGQPVTIAARWVSTSNLSGNWSNPQTVNVP